MRQLAERGVAILMISSDLVLEILGMSDPILVMHVRRIVGEAVSRPGKRGTNHRACDETHGATEPARVR